MAFTKTMVDRAFLRKVAINHLDLAKVYEQGTNATGAAQLRAVANMLFRIADHEGDLDIDADEVGTVLPKVATPREARPPEPERFKEGATVVVKAIGTIRFTIDGPHKAYVVDLEQREFATTSAPSWASTRTTFVMPDEVSRLGDMPTRLPEPDAVAVEMWLSFLHDRPSAHEQIHALDKHPELERGRQLLERLLGR